jgi:hypothetical protein
MTRLRKKIAPEAVEAGAFKNSTRARAVMEIYNPITCASVLYHMQDVKPEFFLSIDNVGVEIGDKLGEFCLFFLSFWFISYLALVSGTRPRLYLAEGSKERLKARNLQPATTKNTTQYRVVNCLIASAASGQIIHAAILITDDRFDHRKTSNINENLSIWLLPVGYDKSWLFAEFLKSHVLPRLQETREDLAQQNIAAISFSPPSQQDGEDANENEEIGQKNWFDFRAVLSFDGESAQMKAAHEEDLLQTCKGQFVEVVKWAAAASLIQQPADIGSMHRTLHNYFSGARLDYTAESAQPSSAMKSFLSQVFSKSKMPAGSRAVFSVFLSHIEAALDKAFTLSSVQKAWKVAGYFPFDIPRIFSSYSGWGDLTAPESEILIK